MKSTFSLRFPDELREKIEREARLNHVSINQYIIYALTKELSYREAERALRDRIQQTLSRKEALELLDAIVPDVPPLPGDE